MDDDALAVARPLYAPDAAHLPQDPSGTLAAFLPTGWMALPIAARCWLLYGPDREAPGSGSSVLVGELTWLHSDEWRVLPVGEILPWARTFPTVLAALDALMSWWNVRTATDTR